MNFLQFGMNNEYKIIYFSFGLTASYLHKTGWLVVPIGIYGPLDHFTLTKMVGYIYKH